MTRLFILLLAGCMLQSIATAQQLNTWKGGHAGQPTAWTCTANWSLGRVPDWTQHVLIPDVATASGHYPTLHRGPFEVASIEIRPGASLVVERQALLIVTGVNSYRTGIWNDGRLVLAGMIDFEGASPRDGATYGGAGIVQHPGAAAVQSPSQRENIEPAGKQQ